MDHSLIRAIARLLTIAIGARLGKAHTQRSVLPESRRALARELDSCNSSDALLMNLFCYPGFSGLPKVARLIGHNPRDTVEFGIKARVPLVAGAEDKTELDMCIGEVIVESKLTESNFTSRTLDVLRTYRDFAAMFEIELLPRTDDSFEGYQLIRNVLCAVAHGHVFVLLCDSRRPDLMRQWWQVARAIRKPEVRSRVRLVLWQELAAEAPAALRGFLAAKYGL